MQTTIEHRTATASQPTARGRDVLRLGRDYGIYVVLLLVVIGATMAYSSFLSWTNVSSVVAQNAPLGIVAVGMTFVIIGGGFDLSVGSVFAVAGTLAAMTAKEQPIVLAFVVAIVAGFVCGVVNALIITVLKVNPFVATLGTSTLFTGLVLLASHNNPVTVDKPGFQWLGQSYLGSVPVPLMVLVLVAAIGVVLLNKAAYGRRVLAVGGSKEASRLAGIRADLTQGSTYVVCSVLAALAGFMSASQLGVGQGTAGSTLALEAIAVVVVGGTSLLGGEGSVVRTMVGLLILATLNNIFFSLAVDTNWQGISQGLIVVAAVALDQLFRRVTPR